MSNEQLKKEIEQEADAITAKLKDNNDYQAGYSKGYEDGYIAAGGKYGIKWTAAEQRIKELEQWKKEAAALLSPLLTWGQAQKDMPLGCDVTKEILRRAKLFTEAEARADRYEKALREIANLTIVIGSPRGNEVYKIANEALTPKTSTDVKAG